MLYIARKMMGEYGHVETVRDGTKFHINNWSKPSSSEILILDYRARPGKVTNENLGQFQLDCSSRPSLTVRASDEI